MPYKDPAKRAAAQKRYETRRRAKTTPEAEAWKQYRREYFRAWHAKKWAEDPEFREYRRAIAREASRRRALKVTRPKSVEALLAKAQALAEAALEVRKRGYSGPLKPDHI